MNSMLMDDLGAGCEEATATDSVAPTPLAPGTAGEHNRHVSDTSSDSNQTDKSNQRHTEAPTTIKGRPAMPLYLSCNPDHLSAYQCLVRKNVELFEATAADVSAPVKGRNKPIVLGQVGIRCIHCRHVYPISERARGAMYYPHTLLGIYQASQILSQGHLIEGSCQYVSTALREELRALKEQKSYATAGKEYWAKTAEVLGVFEDQFGLRFEERIPQPTSDLVEMKDRKRGF